MTLYWGKALKEVGGIHRYHLVDRRRERALCGRDYAGWIRLMAWDEQVAEWDRCVECSKRVKAFA